MKTDLYGYWWVAFGDYTEYVLITSATDDGICCGTGTTSGREYTDIDMYALHRDLESAQMHNLVKLSYKK